MLNAGIFFILVFIAIQYRDYLKLESDSSKSKLKPKSSDIIIEDGVKSKVEISSKEASKSKLKPESSDIIIEDGVKSKVEISSEDGVKSKVEISSEDGVKSKVEISSKEASVKSKGEVSSKEASVDQFLLSLPEEKKEKIRKLILINLLKDSADLEIQSEIKKGGLENDGIK